VYYRGREAAAPVGGQGGGRRRPVQMQILWSSSAGVDYRPNVSWH
jgi:hypothetical protein